jgi:hypothetical protein
LTLSLAIFNYSNNSFTGIVSAHGASSLRFPFVPPAPELE